MAKVLAVVRRELIAYFSSPLAYIVLTAFLLMQGYIFYIIVSFLNNPMTQAMTPLRLFFGGTVFFWLFLLFTVPVITMRLIAEERRSGTIEVLLTSPVTEGQVIAGKFLAALLFYLVLWLPTVLYVVLLKQHSSIDLRPVLAGYLGVLLIGFLFLAVGTFTSTLTNNQLIAAILAFAALVVLFSIGLVEQLMVSSSWLRDALSYMNLWTHMDDYAKGIVDSRHIVYELSVGLLFLFLAAKSLEVKKWR
ncbi:MAG TPA: ABC transporter permease [Thermoanaerobaculales bacterium]|nr:ABC transporter permease [Thermoanaerobaculales bacterium]HPA80467.1 ABC transporter permease [Thermoanaerobaculales bacterium]HQL29850.1 ABC transporter permease [Thermoanaerobaculales bacterium]HQN96796.1 ABC transporter permease [Thermoanaerobaculales bacterium]